MSAVSRTLAKLLLPLIPCTAYADPPDTYDEREYDDVPPAEVYEAPPPEYEDPQEPETYAFDSVVSIGAFYSHWVSEYDADGFGARIRLEPLPDFGIELYAEVLSVDDPWAERMDIPAGFSVYIPFTLLRGLRIRPLAGLCTIFSFANGSTPGAPSSNDIRFGAHVGVGAELAISSHWSVFADATYQHYFGHSRDVDAWRAVMDQTLEDEGSFQFGVGLQLHL